MHNTNVQHTLHHSVLVSHKKYQQKALNKVWEITCLWVNFPTFVDRIRVLTVNMSLDMLVLVLCRSGKLAWSHFQRKVYFFSIKFLRRGKIKQQWFWRHTYFQQHFPSLEKQTNLKVKLKWTSLGAAMKPLQYHCCVHVSINFHQHSPSSHQTFHPYGCKYPLGA